MSFWNSVFALVLMSVVACDSGSSDAGADGDESNGAAASGDCSAAAAGIERDTCTKQRMLGMPASELKQVEKLASEIEDEMIRGAAVETWVQTNCNDVSLDQGRVLCELLEGRNRSYCERRLSSPHLCR